MAKDSRITIRMDDKLDAWLGTEGAKRGLDKTAFARLALYERMNGWSQAAAPVAPQPAAVMRDVLDMASPAAAPHPAPSEPQEPVDIDALVSRQLEEAAAQGLTEPAPEDPIDTSAAAAGVRPLMRRPTPFTQSLPAFLGGQ